MIVYSVFRIFQRSNGGPGELYLITFANEKDAERYLADRQRVSNDMYRIRVVNVQMGYVSRN